MQYLDVLLHRVNREIGICEQTRRVGDLVWDIEDKELRDKIFAELLVVLKMAKKMGDRLTYYHKLTGDTSGTQGNNLVQYSKEEIKRLRRLRKCR
jgi:hypothetical protein